MQTETLQSPTLTEPKKYLRVATIANKAAYSFFYIGSNEQNLAFLSENFKTGRSAQNFELAFQLLRLNDFRSTDVIILDLPYHSKSVTELGSFLSNRQMAHIPVIYNQQFTRNADLSKCVVTDDVIDLNNWQYDFSRKISFLKKSKAYQPAAVSQRARSIEPTKPFSKRAFDILVSVVLLTLLLPVFLLVALAVKLESRGPVFYNSKRAGRGFRIFNFYKFRTMEVNADSKIEALSHLNQYDTQSQGARFFKINNDPRITKVGRFLRNTSLDELPQLINVLKGDMSLVGNRPLPLYEASTLTTNEFVERFMAPAGITGLWQIKKRGKADMSSEERIGLDISYARNSTLLQDLYIMFNTPKALLQKTDV